MEVIGHPHLSGATLVHTVEAIYVLVILSDKIPDQSVQDYLPERNLVSNFSKEVDQRYG
jgi:hypothetical protein